MQLISPRGFPKLYYEFTHLDKDYLRTLVARGYVEAQKDEKTKLIPPN